MLNIVQHTLQQIEEVLLRGSAKRKPLHEIPTASVYCLQTGNTFLKDLEAIEINIKGPNTLEIRKI